MGIGVMKIVHYKPDEDAPIRTFYIPAQINPSEVVSISPFVADSGRYFRNVSVVSTTTSGDTMTVVGNYKSLLERMEKSDRIVIKGFKR